MAWAYFDETAFGEKTLTAKRVPADMFVGGCIASQERWQEFSAEWNKALKEEKVAEFHAKLFYQFRKPFDWFTLNAERDWHRHNAFRDRLADLISHYVDEAIIINSEISLKRGKIKQVYSDAVIRTLHDFSKMPDPQNKTFVIFARHPEISPWSIIRFFEQMDWEGRLAGCGVLDAKDVPPLQAADFVLNTINKLWGGEETPQFKRLQEGFANRGKVFRQQLASTFDTTPILQESSR